MQPEVYHNKTVPGGKSQVLQPPSQLCPQKLPHPHHPTARVSRAEHSQFSVGEWQKEQQAGWSKALNSGVEYYWDQLNETVFTVHSNSRSTERPGTSRVTWRTDRDMGLMNAIGLQPRNPTTSVTSQGTQTLTPQLQNAETQTEREIQEPGGAASGSAEGLRQASTLP
uniref:Uncharacterized protein n=1 Tax=Sphaerodactylus townsendi TaxID=933632 RepID=A0ACB8G3E0_9SAUR